MRRSCERSCCNQHADRNADGDFRKYFAGDFAATQRWYTGTDPQCDQHRIWSGCIEQSDNADRNFDLKRLGGGDREFPGGDGKRLLGFADKPAGHAKPWTSGHSNAHIRSDRSGVSERTADHQQYVIHEFNGDDSPKRYGEPHQVDLSWQAPSGSNVAIAGYNVYRASSGTSSYALLNSMDAQTAFNDISVQGGQTYNYYVTSVDSSGAESAPSNTTTVTIP